MTLPSTRHSAHTLIARTVDAAGKITTLDADDATLNLDESLSPYGDATVQATLTDAVRIATDPLTHRGLRLQLELSESTGDPVIILEITADHGGSVAALTASYGPALAPAKLTAIYYTAWNDDVAARPGGAIRVDLFVTGRTVDHEAGTITLTAATDEALLTAYKLLATTSQTSGSLTVRGTVNYALAKVGAALLPGIDAPVVEADAIIWEPGVNGWDYARNVAEAAGLVVRCDEHRRWTLTERGTTRPEMVPLYGFTLATETVDLQSDLWADAVVVHYDWLDSAGTPKVRYETATRTADPVKVVTIDRFTPYPGPGAAKYWLNRLKARGRVFEFEQVGDYTLRPGMGFTASLPTDLQETGYIESVSWSLPSDRGSIRTRGAADAKGNEIDLWPMGTKIDQLVGKIDALIVDPSRSEGVGIWL